MASKYLQKFPVPDGFQELLADFTREVLRAQPKNIVEFATHYFEALEKGRKADLGNRNSDSVSSKKIEDITSKAASIAGKVAAGQH